jgi:uncharacterized protein (TIGR02284 family)
MKNQEQSIEVLNTLIEINNNRIEWYETASNEIKNTELKDMFFQFVQTSKKCITELISEVLQLGGVPTKEPTTSGKFFRAWIDVKAAIMKDNHKEILDSCEYGEYVAVSMYKKILTDKLKYLNADQQYLLNKQYVFLKADHDKVREMKDMLVEYK